MTTTPARFLATLVALFLFASSAYGQVEPDPTRQVAWEQFKSQQGSDWEVNWNAKTGTPASIASGKTKPYSGPPDKAAETFLKEHYRLFEMNPDLSGLKLDTVRQVRNVHHVRFQQTYQSLPVYDAEYLVHILTDGRIIMANGTYYPEIEVPTTPQLSKETAQKIALNDLKGNAELGGNISSRLVIYPKDEQFHLAWELNIPLAPFGGWVYFVDAESGNVLDRLDELVDVTGTGKVYPIYPGYSSSPSAITKSLYRLDGTRYLRGTYANVVNDKAARAYSSTHTFSYSTTDTHFDEANLYYHIDKFRSGYINNLADVNTPLGFTQITAHAHSTHPTSGDLNAWFDRSSGTRGIYFGDASSSPSYNDFAKEDKVIYHEYGHAVIYYQNSGIRSNDPTEEGSISEGVPDYFAGAHTGRSRIGEYVNSSIARNMAAPFYSSYSSLPRNSTGAVNVEVHRGGEFFSAVLWDLRRNSGITAGEADWLVYAALSFVSSTPTFLTFRDAMVAEDGNRYNGAHNCLIKSVFAARGIGYNCPSPPSPPTNLTIVNSGTTGLSPHLSWTRPSGSVTRYDVYRCLDDPFISSDCNGTSSFTKIGSTTSTSYFDNTIQTRSSCGTTGTVFYKVALYHVKTVSSGGTSGASNQVGTCSNQPTNKQGVADLTAQGGALEALPAEYTLEANYPNPFNPTTEIRFALPEAADVRLIVYDALGREVERLVDGPVSAGYQHATFEAANLPSGLYLYRLEATGGKETFAKTGQMVLVK